MKKLVSLISIGLGVMAGGLYGAAAPERINVTANVVMLCTQPSAQQPSESVFEAAEAAQVPSFATYYRTNIPFMLTGPGRTYRFCKMYLVP